MTGKKKRRGKDTTDTSKQGENGTPQKVQTISIRTATEEDYRKRPRWNVGTFHRASTLAAPEPSDGKEKPPQNPQELVEALEKRGIRVNVMSNAQLEARRRADLEMDAWHGKHKK